MKKYIIVVLIAIISTLQVKLWSGDGSLIELFSLNQKIVREQASIQKNTMRNELLKLEVANLKIDKAAIVEQARVELGMIMPGETFYQVVEPVI